MATDNDVILQELRELSQRFEERSDKLERQFDGLRERLMDEVAQIRTAAAECRARQDTRWENHLGDHVSPADLVGVQAGATNGKTALAKLHDMRVEMAGLASVRTDGKTALGKVQDLRVEVAKIAAVTALGSGVLMVILAELAKRVLPQLFSGGVP